MESGGKMSRRNLHRPTAAWMSSVLVALCLSTVPLVASATVIYSSIPNLDVISTSGGLWCSSCEGLYEPLDKFTLDQPAAIRGFNLVTGAGVYSAAGQFTIEIYDAERSKILFSEHVSARFVENTVDTLDPSEIVTGRLSGLNLPAGTYWFAAFNDTLLGLPGFSGGNGSLIQTIPHTGVEVTPDFAVGNLGYQLLSAAPESSTWAMMLTGLGGLGAILRSLRSEQRGRLGAS